LTLRIERTTRFRGFSNGHAAVESSSEKLARPALTDTCADASAELPAKLRFDLQDLARGFAVHRRVPIVVPRREAMLPWEACIRQTVLATQTSGASELWLYRPVPASQRSSSGSRPPWSRYVRLIHDSQDLWVQPIWSADRVTSHAVIVHAIGVPTRKSYAVRLQIDRADPATALAAEQLSTAIFLVLQLPVVDSLVRGGTDRQQVADLRELAFDVARSGTPFVLVIPALTKDDAVLLISALARRLEETQPSLDRMLAITEHLRSLLLRPKDPHAAALRELAFDITLFAADTGPLPGGKTTK
jgi:hypothetical protein